MNKKIKVILTAVLILSISLFALACNEPAPTPPPPAQNVTISFDAAGGTAVAPLTVEQGTVATAPQAPTRGKDKFLGWYNGDVLFDWTSAISADVNLTAKWQLAHTVTLKFGNGADDYSYVVYDGEKSPAYSRALSYDGHDFMGWYKDGKLYDWNTPVTSNITLKAIWKGNYSGVTLDFYAVGSMNYSNGTYTTTGPSMVITSKKKFIGGTIEVDVKATTASDNGIILGLTAESNSLFANGWEGEGIEFYNFFVSRAGKAYLGRSRQTEYIGGWACVGEAEIENYNINNTYRLKVVMDGTTLMCYVNDELYIVFSEYNFMVGRFGLRAGAAGVTFSNFSVTGEINA